MIESLKDMIPAAADVSQDDDRVYHRFAYDSESVAIARKLPNAKYEPTIRGWSYSAKTKAAISRLIDGIVAIEARQAELAQAKAIAEQERARERTAEAARRSEIARSETAEDRSARKTKAAAARANRTMILAYSVGVGSTVRLNDKVVVIESLGRAWKSNDDDDENFMPPEMWGCSVQYAYWRDATDAEAAVLVESEARYEAAARAKDRRSAAIASVATSKDKPDLGRVPEGETLWSDERHAAVGWRSRIVLTADGWLWHVQYDGSDGAVWGDYNCGWNTVGSRVPADPAIVDAIRGAP